MTDPHSPRHRARAATGPLEAAAALADPIRLGGLTVHNRLAEPEDWPRVVDLHTRCSLTALRARWGRTSLRPQDYRRLRESGLVLIAMPDGQPDHAVALTTLSRFTTAPDRMDLGLQVVDHLHGRGLGAALARRAIRIARACGAHELSAYIQATNQPMLAVMRSLGAHLTRPSDGVVDALLDLNSPA